MLDGRTPLEVAGRLGLALGMTIFMGLAFEGVYKREARTSPGDRKSTRLNSSHH